MEFLGFYWPPTPIYVNFQLRALFRTSYRSKMAKLKMFERLRLNKPI